MAQLELANATGVGNLHKSVTYTNVCVKSKRKGGGVEENSKGFTLRDIYFSSKKKKGKKTVLFSRPMKKDF